MRHFMFPLFTLSLLALSLALVAPAAVSAQTTIYSYSVPLNGGYDAAGNVKNYTDTVTGTWALNYNNLDQLQSATATAGTPQGLTLTWVYDSFGNRLSQTPSGTSAMNVPPALQAAYGPNNQMWTNNAAPVRVLDMNGNVVAGVVHDAAGNMVFDGVNKIAYDAENRACAIFNTSTGQTAQYLYNAEGQRIAKGHPKTSTPATLGCPTVASNFSPDETYIIGPGGEQVTQLDGAGTWQHTNVYTNGQLLATYDREVTSGNNTAQLLHFNFSDALGTKRMQTTPVGAVELRCFSLPFGDDLSCTGPGQDATSHHFTGKERDAESGLDYLGARYYGSSMGRFMSPDPVIMSPARMANPQLWNAYSYVGNNPLNAVDPQGEELVMLGQHTDQEIKDRIKAINAQLKDKSLLGDAKDALKAEKHTLGLEKEGNAVAGAYLKALDSVGQRNNLQLSDITLSTDVAHDFAGMGLSNAQQAKISNPDTQAFVLNRSGPMYLKSQTSLFQNTFDPTSGMMLQDFGGTVLRHEQAHTARQGEFGAYTVQRQVWQYFKNNLSPETFNRVNDMLQKSIDSNRDH